MDSKSIFFQSTNKDTIKETISSSSTREEVISFLERYINFKGTSLNITGKELFKLSENDMNKLGMDLVQRKKLINYIKQQIQNKEHEKEDEEEYDIDITSNSNSEEVSKFLKEKLHFSQDIINELNLNAEELFLLDYEELDKQKYLLDKNVTNKLNKFIEKRKKISNDNKSFLNKSKDEIKKSKTLSHSKKEKLSSLIKEKENLIDMNENKNEYKIQPLNDNSNYNVFIIIALKKNFYKNIKLVFYDISFYSYSVCKLKYRILNVNTEFMDNQILYELFLIQIELNNFCEELCIKMIDNNNNELFDELYVQNINNYFYFDNICFDESCEEIYSLSDNIIFNEFYKYFFKKNSSSENKFIKDMMLCLINNETEILLSGDNILKILKNCLKYKLNHKEIIKYIKLDIKENSYIEKESILSNSEIDNLFSDSEIMKMILLIYITQLKQKELLNEIIFKINYQDEISKVILNLLNDEIISPKDLFFYQKLNLKDFQLLLLIKISRKMEINKIIAISENLATALEFIEMNYITLYKKIYSLTKFYEINYFQIDLSELKIGGNLSYILELLKKIFTLSNDNSYHFINYEKIFISLDTKFFQDDIDIYFLLSDFVTLTEKFLSQKIINEFYDKVHEKGINMIKNEQMEEEKIFLFMSKIDRYYYSPNFNKSDKREPEIMKYIKLTDISPKYLKNIELMKKFNIISLFLNSSMEEKFYKFIIGKIRKILDLKFIFEIFTQKDINEKFTNLINYIVKIIKDTIINVRIEDYADLFNIFDNLLQINFKHFNKISIINELFLSINISKQYFIYLMNKKAEINESIIFQVIDVIIESSRSYFDEDKNNSSDLLIEIILNSKDKYTKYIFEKINDLCIEEKDFYKKEKTSKFILYSKFINKCNNLFKQFEDIEGTYPCSIKIINNKILKDLKNGNIKFELFISLMLEAQEFENKIKLITSGENEAKLLYENLKNGFEHCQKDFSNIERILEYFSTFFSNSKKDSIEIIKEKQMEYKEDKNISELINLDINNFLNIKHFYLNEVIEESKNIKYKCSSYFMAIYKNHYKKDKLEKSEEKILKDSINDYINIIKEIIEKLELKLSLFEIKNIDLIVRESLNPEFNFDKEIDFIKQEIQFINFKEYIEKRLKNDLILFIEKFQFMHLIQGIIKFINYNYKINANKNSNIFGSVKTIYHAIISKKLNEKYFVRFINLLKQNENYINNGDMLIKFYKILLEKRKSLAFLQNIENSLRNKSGNELFNSNEMNNLLNIFIFFKKLLENKEIKSDKDFYKIYNEEIEKNNNIKNSLSELNNKFTQFISKKEGLKENQISDIDNSNKEKLLLIQFSYNCNLISIQGNIKEKVKNIIDKFIVKTSADRNIIYFLYGGTIIKEEQFLFEIISREDKLRNQMNILVNSISDENQNKISPIIKSKEVICPKCFENINLKIFNYKISLFDCKNGHSFKELLFKDFLNTQNINLKKINCDICKQRNKYDTYNNEFFRCFTCAKNLCPMCKSIHIKTTHKIFSYDKRNSICQIHFDSYNSYCKNCKKNLCMKCEKGHINHNKIYFGNILPDYEQNEKGIRELEKSINQFNANIDDIIQRLKSLKENMNHYYQIYANINKNIENQNRNYQILNNMIEINNSYIINDIKNIIKEKNIKDKVSLMLDIINKNKIYDNNEITLIYKINNNEKFIKIFDSAFVQNNKDICKIIYDNEEIELKENLNVDSIKEKIEIRLKGIQKIMNSNRMFYGCKSLISIPDIIKWDLSKVKEKNEMFKGCNQLIINQ